MTMIASTAASSSDRNSSSAWFEPRGAVPGVAVLGGSGLAFFVQDLQVLR